MLLEVASERMSDLVAGGITCFCLQEASPVSACRRHHLFLLFFGEELSDEHFIGTVDMAYHDDCCLLACDMCRLIEGYSCIRGSSQISMLVPILHSTTTQNTAIVDSRDCENLISHGVSY